LQSFAIVPSTYYTRLAERRDLSRLSTQAKRDVVLKPEIKRVFKDNRKIYGVRKVWHQMRREGHDIARCTVARSQGRKVARSQGRKVNVRTRH